MRKIEHIGIAVKSLETSNLLFEKLFGQPPYKQEEVASEGVKTSFSPERELYIFRFCVLYKGIFFFFLELFPAFYFNLFIFKKK